MNKQQLSDSQLSDKYGSIGLKSDQTPVRLEILKR